MRIRRGKTRNCGVEFGGKVGKDDSVGNTELILIFKTFLERRRLERRYKRIIGFVKLGTNSGAAK